MNEQTPLNPSEEADFQGWVRQNGIRDVDASGSNYDYRGFWKSTQGAPHPPGSELHFPDTFKQHGHRTFSVESQYSQGPFDGGRWIEDAYVPPGADMMMNSRGQSRVSPLFLRDALLAQMGNR